MAKVPIGLRLEPEMIAAVDAARGDVARVRWIERAIEAALDHGPLATTAANRIKRGSDVSREDAALRRQAKLNAAKYGTKR